MAAMPPALTPPVPPTISEAVSQNAYNLKTPQQFDQFVSTQPGGAQLTPAQKRELYGTVEKTRTTHGLPPANAAPQTSPQGPEDMQRPNASGGTQPGQVPPPGPLQPGSSQPEKPPQGAVPAPAVDYNTPLKAPDPLVVPPPPAHETVPQFKGAQYHPPAKGLEYLATALTLLFPGAPIAHAASSFAQGLGRGAEQRYNRDEGQAEKTYGQQVAQSNADAAGAQRDWQVKLEQAKAARQGSVDTTNVFNQDVLAARGQHATDVKEGKFFKVPPELTRILPPGEKRAPVEGDYANHYGALARAAMQQGATDLARDYTRQAEDWRKAGLEKQKETLAMTKMMLTFQQQEHLLDVREAHTDARSATREAYSYARAEAADRRADTNIMLRYRDDANRAGRDFQKIWGEATRPGTGSRAWGYQDPQTKEWKIAPSATTPVNGAAPQPIMVDKLGHVVPMGQQLPPEISDSQKGVISKMIQRIVRAPDPQGLADAFANHQQNSTVQQVLQSAGQYADLNRRAQGGMIVEMPDSYYAKLFPKVAAPKPTSLPPDMQKRFSALPPDAQSMLQSELTGGKTVEQIRAEVQASGSPIKAQILEALSHPAPMPALPPGRSALDLILHGGK